MSQLPIIKIRLDGGTQTRAAIRPEIVEEYAELIREGKELTAVVIFNDGKDYWLADGFHRVHAYRAAGKSQIPANIRQGTQQDALLYAAGANDTHGLRRSPEDKRECVRMILAVPEWASRSDNWIAGACKVSQPFVGKVRASLTYNVISQPDQPPPEPETRTGRDGRTINTSNIGKPADPEPSRFCDRCQRVGPTKNCSACARIQAQAGVKTRPAKTREPGEDNQGNHDERPAPKNGTPLFNAREFKEHLWRARALLNNLAHQYGLEKHHRRGAPSVVVTPPHAGIVRKLEEVEADTEKWQRDLKKAQKVKE